MEGLTKITSFLNNLKFCSNKLKFYSDISTFFLETCLYINIFRIFETAHG